MDIFKMATQIASGMSDEDKQAIESMDMEKMISHVTKNVFKMMNGSTEMPDIDISNLMGVVNQDKVLPKTRDICFDLNVDLVDFYTSKKKKLNIKRKRIIEVDGKQKVVEEKKKIIIPIEKGMKDEQQIRFEGQADQIPGYEPGDIVITLIENEHPIFQRDGDNLIISKNINLYQIYDYTFDITHLDSKIIRISKNDNDSLHLNNSLRKVPGQGMPVYNRENEYGDLFVRFNLVIPKCLEQSTLIKLKEIFDQTTEELNETYDSSFLLENVTDTDLEEFDSESGTEIDSDSDTDSEISVSSDESSEYEAPRRSKRR
jgi:DnaJ-class molecular chaperone